MEVQKRLLIASCAYARSSPFQSKRPAHKEILMKSIKLHLTSADVAGCCTKTQPITLNSKQCRCRSMKSDDPPLNAMIKKNNWMCSNVPAQKPVEIPAAEDPVIERGIPRPLQERELPRACQWESSLERISSLCLVGFLPLVSDVKASNCVRDRQWNVHMFIMANRSE